MDVNMFMFYECEQRPTAHVLYPVVRNLFMAARFLFSCFCNISVSLEISEVLQFTTTNTHIVVYFVSHSPAAANTHSSTNCGFIRCRK